MAAAPPPLPEKFVNPAALLPQRADIDSDDEDDDEDEDDYARGGGRGAGSGAGVSSPSQPRTRKQYKMVKAVPPKKGKGSKKVAVPKKKEVDKQPEEEAKEGGGGGRFGWGSKKKDEEDEEEPLLESSNKDNQETKDMVTTIKNMTGLWDIDPEDSSWMHIVSKVSIDDFFVAFYLDLPFSITSLTILGQEPSRASDPHGLHLLLRADLAQGEGLGHARGRCTH